MRLNEYGGGCVYKKIAIFLAMLLFIPQAASGSYITQEVTLRLEADDLGNETIPMENITRPTFSDEITTLGAPWHFHGRLLRASSPVSTINLTFSQVRWWVYFSKADIMEGVVNMTIMLPFHKLIKNITIYTMPMYTADTSKMTVWYSSEYIFPLYDSNRTYVNLPLVAIVPDRLYMFQVDISTPSNTSLYITTNDPVEKQINKLQIDSGPVLNISADWQIMVHQFIGGNGGVFQVPEGDAYYFNLTRAFTIPSDANGKVYAYVDHLKNANISQNCTVYYTLNSTHTSIDFDFSDYTIKKLSDNATWLGAVFGIKYKTNNSGHLYIPLRLDTRLNMIRVDDVHAGYTIYSHFRTTFTLLYTEEAVTYTAEAQVPDNPKIITGVPIVDSIFSKALEVIINNLPTSVKEFGASLYNNYLHTMNKVLHYVNNLFTEFKKLGAGVIHVVTFYYETTKTFVVALYESQIYQFLSSIIPALLVIVVFVPGLLILFRTGLFMKYLLRNNLKKAAVYRKFKFW